MSKPQGTVTGLKANRRVFIQPQIFIDLLFCAQYSDEFRGCTSQQKRQGLSF